MQEQDTDICSSAGATCDLKDNETAEIMSALPDFVRDLIATFPAAEKTQMQLLYQKHKFNPNTLETFEMNYDSVVTAALVKEFEAFLDRAAAAAALKEVASKKEMSAAKAKMSVRALFPAVDMKVAVGVLST